MKKISLFLGLFSLILAGCANTQGLTEDEQREAAIKYPMMWANLQPDDGGVAVTAKIITRVLLFPLTIGLSELEFLEDRNKTFSQYADYLNTKYYYDGFLGKNKSHALMQLGAPTRTCPDGNGGEICVYERTYSTGGEIYTIGDRVYSNPYRIHKKIKELYFDKNNLCYHWRVRTE